MKVNVSKKDIDNGICGDERKCALALAVSRAFYTKNVAVFYEPYSDEEEVGSGRGFLNLRIKVDNEYYSYSHIDEAEHCDNFIHWFDNGETDDCKPFEFKIDTSRTTI